MGVAMNQPSVSEALITPIYEDAMGSILTKQTDESNAFIKTIDKQYPKFDILHA
jgi:hypothetical protein